MEVPVVKIREGEAGAEEKTIIRSIVNMVQYNVWLFVWLTNWGELWGAAWVLIHTGYGLNHSAWLTHWWWIDVGEYLNISDVVLDICITNGDMDSNV